MKVDLSLGTWELGDLPETARWLQTCGYDGLFTAETKHDPFLPLVLAAEHAPRLELGTSIAVAFPRSPMHLAHLGHDLQRASAGKFILGLGSQVRAHVERRFSAAFDRPAARMRDLVQALRAIWRCWEHDEPLRYEGEFYRHTLMTPFFNPGPTGFGPPRVFIAGVGEKMTEVAGEVADGLFVHAFTTPEYLRAVTLPALARGCARSNRSRPQLQLSMAALTIVGDDDEGLEVSRRAIRQQVAFYASTPTYRPVLELHGWGDLQGELNLLSKRGEWETMGKLIDDDILDSFTVSGTPERLPEIVLDRFSGLIDRVGFYTPSPLGRDTAERLVGAFTAAVGRTGQARHGGVA
jgi:probable F420-dependent oxidoreductase